MVVVVVQPGEIRGGYFLTSSSVRTGAAAVGRCTAATPLERAVARDCHLHLPTVSAVLPCKYTAEAEKGGEGRGAAER